MPIIRYFVIYHKDTEKEYVEEYPNANDALWEAMVNNHLQTVAIKVEATTLWSFKGDI